MVCDDDWDWQDEKGLHLLDVVQLFLSPYCREILRAYIRIASHLILSCRRPECHSNQGKPWY